MQKRKFKEEEITLLKMLSTGKEDAEIAKTLNISINTVRNWISKLFFAFGAENRAHLAAQAIRENVIK